MENEKIFVVVPVYKVEAYLERCIDSILNQTYKNFELILVDDGSPDNCPAICDRYAAEHDNITVIHQENGGLSAARNTGIEYAMKNGNPECDWINFIDSDDFVHPKYLDYLYRAVKEAGTNISSCTYVRTEATTIEPGDIGQLKYKRISPQEYWCKNRSIACHAWGKLYRISLFHDIEYPVGKLYEDEFTTYKILFQHGEIAFLQKPLYHWYFNQQSITNLVWTPHRIDQLDALEAQLAFFQKHGYHAAYKSVVETLFLNCVIQVRSVRAMSPKYDCLLKDMKQRQLRATKLYAKYFGYPRTIQELFDIRIRRPLKHMLRNESLFAFLCRKIKKKLCLRKR